MTSDPMVAAERQISLEYQLREKVVNEEFKIWKKTVPLLYNTIYTHASKWPMLSVDFLPDYTYSTDKNSISVKYVTGTNTSGKAPDSVVLHSLSLPATLAPDFSSVSTNEIIAAPSEEVPADPSQVLSSWNHEGEVNAVKVSPKGSHFATFDNKGVVHLYNVNSQASQALTFHTKEGFSLEWMSESGFLSGAFDGVIAQWDTSAPSKPVSTFTSHTSAINGISYSKPSGVLFGSVSDDYNTHIHDLRTSEDSVAIEIVESHIQNAIAFHPTISYLLATGGKDNVVNLYDARNTKAPIRQLYGHNGSVSGIKWSPVEATSLLSWGLDRRILTWDLSQLREEYNPGESNEGKKRSKLNEDPCLQFIHGGHTNNINDFAVHPSVPNLFASVADDNLVEIYQPKSAEDDEAEEEEEEEEEAEAEEEAEGAVEEDEKDRSKVSSNNSNTDGMELDEGQNGKLKTEPANEETITETKTESASANEVQDTEMAV